MNLPKNSKCLLIALVLSMLFVLFFAQAAFAQEIRLSASQETGYVGDTVAVKVSITNALDTEGGQFDLYFGPALAGANLILEPVSATRGDFVPDVSGNLFDSNLNVGGNKLRVLWVNAEGSTKDSGVVCTINFKITGEGETPLTFSDWVIVDPLVGRFIATPTAGKVTGLGQNEKQYAIELAEDAIDALPENVKCSDKEDVEEARYLVSRAKTQHGAVDSDFSNLNKLEDAEEVIAKCEAIREADDAIYALPSVDNLKLDDKPKVEEARYLVNRAKTQHGAVDSDFVYLTRLVAAENRIKELEGQKPTPPTGGTHYLIIGAILVLLCAGILYQKKRQLLTGQ